MTAQEVGEILKGSFTLDIPNFEKWNPPTKNKRSWIKLDPHWHDDPKLRAHSPSAKLFWILLLSLRGASVGPLSNLTRTSLVHLGGIPGTSVELLLSKLVNSGLLVLIEERKRERKKPSKRALKETTPTSQEKPTFDLESLYSLYPRKKGKAAGLKKLASAVTDAESFERVRSGIVGYAAECRRENREQKYIAHFSTFVSEKRWEDYHAAPGDEQADPHVKHYEFGVQRV